jgi:hypothetical protein
MLRTRTSEIYIGIHVQPKNSFLDFLGPRILSAQVLTFQATNSDFLLSDRAHPEKGLRRIDRFTEQRQCFICTVPYQCGKKQKQRLESCTM